MATARCREVVRTVGVVPMLTVTQILIAYSDEGGVHCQLARKTIESGRVPGNRCHD
jgi:hypothetical protein